MTTTPCKCRLCGIAMQRQTITRLCAACEDTATTQVLGDCEAKRAAREATRDPVTNRLPT